MTDSLPVTEVVERVRRGDRDVGELLAYYQRDMEAYARRKIGRALQQSVGGSDIYSESFANVIAVLQQSGERIRDRSQFRIILLTAMSRGIISARRRERAKKRGGGKVVPLPDDVAARVGARSVLDEVVAIELAKTVQHCLDEITDPLNRAAAIERFAYGAAASSIRATLKFMFRKRKIPSERTIERRNLKVQAKLKRRLEAGGFRPHIEDSHAEEVGSRMRRSGED